MKRPILKAKITLDTFFKSQARVFFGLCGYLVETEHEMLKNPKKLDVLLIKQNTTSRNSPTASDIPFTPAEMHLLLLKA